jgi:hypothetical protein
MAFETAYQRLSRTEKTEALSKWNAEAHELLKEEGVELNGSALKYYLLGYVQDRKDKLDGACG